MMRKTKVLSMRWSETLPVEGAKIVDECLERILPQDWRRRRSVIEAAIDTACRACTPVSRGSEAGRAEAARFMSGAIVAAIIEKLDSPAIVEADQAQLFAMSASLDHQTAACDWFIQQCARTSFAADAPESRAGLVSH
jgi:hypothetical protein